MIVSDDLKLALFRDAWRSIIASGKWPSKAPPNRQGQQKPVAHALGVATWARELTRTAVYVLENDGKRAEDGSAAPAAGDGALSGESGAPF